MSLRVTGLEAYRRWREDPEGDLAQILDTLRGKGPETEAMRAGTAFHKALEAAVPGSNAYLEADGYRFAFACDACLALPSVREMLVQVQYPGVTVRGRVDALDGLTVQDHKTTGRPLDAEALFAGYQWRGYLSMLVADRFVWNVFEMEPVDVFEAAGRSPKSQAVEVAGFFPITYSVRALHQLEQRRYPGLDSDWRRLVSDAVEFCSQHCPELLESPC